MEVKIDYSKLKSNAQKIYDEKQIALDKWFSADPKRLPALQKLYNDKARYDKLDATQKAVITTARKYRPEFFEPPKNFGQVYSITPTAPKTPNNILDKINKLGLAGRVDNVSKAVSTASKSGYLPDYTNKNIGGIAKEMGMYPLNKLMQTLTTVPRAAAAGINYSIDKTLKDTGLQSKGITNIADFVKMLKEKNISGGDIAKTIITNPSVLKNVPKNIAMSSIESLKAGVDPLINTKSKYANTGYTEVFKKQGEGTALTKPFEFTEGWENGNWGQRLLSGLAGSPAEVAGLAADILLDPLTYLTGGLTKGAKTGVNMVEDLVKGGMKVLPKGAEIGLNKAGRLAYKTFAKAKYGKVTDDIAKGIMKASNGATDNIAKSTMLNALKGKAVNEFLQEIPDVVTLNKYLDLGGTKFMGATMIPGYKYAKLGKNIESKPLGGVIQKIFNANAGLPDEMRPIKGWLQSAGEAEKAGFTKTFADIVKGSNKVDLDKVQKYLWQMADIERAENKLNSIYEKLADISSVGMPQGKSTKVLTKGITRVEELIAKYTDKIKAMALTDKQLGVADNLAEFWKKVAKQYTTSTGKPLSTYEFYTPIRYAQDEGTKLTHSSLLGTYEQPFVKKRNITMAQAEKLQEAGELGKPEDLIKASARRLYEQEQNVFRTRMYEEVKQFGVSSVPEDVADVAVDYKKIEQAFGGYDADIAMKSISTAKSSIDASKIKSIYVNPRGLTGKDIDVIFEVDNVDDLIGKKINLGMVGGKPVDVAITDGKKVVVSFQNSPNSQIWKEQNIPISKLKNNFSNVGINIDQLNTYSKYAENNALADTITKMKANQLLLKQGYSQTAIDDILKKDFTVGQYNKLIAGTSKVKPKIPPGMIEVKNIPELKGLYVPKEYAKALSEVQSMFFGDKSFKKLLSVYDKGLTIWKRAVLATPGYHFRNFFTDNVSGLMEWGVDFYNPKYWDAHGKIIGKQHKLITIGGVKRYADDIFKEMTETGELVTQSATEGLIGGASTKLGKAIQKISPAEASLKIGAKREDIARVIGGLIERDAGASKIMAADKVKKVFFDYAHSLSSGERNVGKRIIPFYTWMKNNLRRQAELILTRTGRYAAIPKAMNFVENISDKPEGYKEFQQPYLKDLNAIATPLRQPGLPDWIADLMGRQRAGQSGNMLQYNPNLAFQDWSRLNYKDFMSSVSPFIKMGLELKFNKNIFYDNPIYSKGNIKVKAVEASSLLQKILGKAPDGVLEAIGMFKREEDGQIIISPRTNYILSQLPQYGLSQRGFAGTENSAYQNLSAGGGIKLTPYDEEIAKNQYQNKWSTEADTAIYESAEKIGKDYKYPETDSTISAYKYAYEKAIAEPYADILKTKELLKVVGSNKFTDNAIAKALEPYYAELDKLKNANIEDLIKLLGRELTLEEIEAIIVEKQAK